ncbi:MAG TPA: leucyl/phenylalanyl-tRNA--protein transferase [Verrucomicrobiae bacterium]|nr:leucyl/phenylalanyl-tRNA--protein transferase [Verrucomicrobiae bacterium]
MDNPIRLHWLDPRNPRQPFPPPELAMRDPNGLLAIGGDLSATRLINAYAQGIFPWYNPDEPILWWCPDPRAVLVPRDFHASRSLERRAREGDFAVTLDRDFPAVVQACSAPRARGRGTWLGAEMKQAYLELHRRGHAHSIEVWRGGELAGGLYGVSLGRVFYGESMFSRIDDGSKLAMLFLCRQLAAWDFALMDCQIASPHLATLGAIELPRERFLAVLRDALAQNGPAVFRFSIDVPADPAQLPA